MYHIHKLGGTTVGNYKYYKNIFKIASNSYNPIFVVSAINIKNKDFGTTTQLINLYNNWNKYKDISFDSMIEDEGLIRNILLSHKYLEDKLEINIDKKETSETIIKEEVIKWKLEMTNINNINNFIYLGEYLSANILERYLNKKNLLSKKIDLSKILINSKYNINNYKNREKLILDTKKFQLNFNRYQGIPIFTGFFGIGGNGTYDILGRGYSDTTSAILSSSFNSQLTVWKESGGVFTGHPFKLKETKQIDKISLNEAIELTEFGNDVLHSSTSQFMKDNNFEIDIKDIRNIDDQGTKIINDKINKFNLLIKTKL